MAAFRLWAHGGSIPSQAGIPGWGRPRRSEAASPLVLLRL